jgi:hypothetical protein
MVITVGWSPQVLSPPNEGLHWDAAAIAGGGADAQGEREHCYQ